MENTIADRIQIELARLEKSNAASDVFAERGDFSDLISLLQVAFCNHEFELKRTGGDLTNAGSNEAVRVCKRCGAEE